MGNNRKTVIDKVSGMLQVMITHLEYLEVTKDGPVTNDDLFKLLNKTSAEVVQVVIDYERANGLEQQLLPFTTEHMSISYDSYRAGYNQALENVTILERLSSIATTMEMGVDDLVSLLITTAQQESVIPEDDEGQ